MILKDDISKIKRNIENSVGFKVRLESVKGKKQPVIKEGVIEKAYQSIFTVLIYDNHEPKRKVSYSYTDVLTKTINVTIFD